MNGDVDINIEDVCQENVDKCNKYSTLKCKLSTLLFDEKSYEILISAISSVNSRNQNFI